VYISFVAKIKRMKATDQLSTRAALLKLKKDRKTLVTYTNIYQLHAEKKDTYDKVCKFVIAKSKRTFFMFLIV
jgi:hypothetical protein